MQGEWPYSPAQPPTPGPGCSHPATPWCPEGQTALGERGAAVRASLDTGYAISAHLGAQTSPLSWTKWNGLLGSGLSGCCEPGGYLQVSSSADQVGRGPPGASNAADLSEFTSFLGLWLGTWGGPPGSSRMAVAWEPCLLALKLKSCGKHMGGGSSHQGLEMAVGASPGWRGGSELEHSVCTHKAPAPHMLQSPLLTKNTSVHLGGEGHCWGLVRAPFHCSWANSSHSDGDRKRRI